MIIASETYFIKFPRLLHYLKNELPKVVDNKPLLNAYIMTAATNGGRRQVPKGKLFNYELIGKMALRPGGGPTALVLPIMKKLNPKTKAVERVDAMTIALGNSITFNARLFKGLEAMVNLNDTRAAFELVSLHELTHWLHARGTANPEHEIGEIGEEFEAAAYSSDERKARQLVIDAAYMLAAAG